MNKRLPLLTAALLLTGASSAFAASSTDLTVTGIITPTACTPDLSNSGTVDFGKRSAKDLNQTTRTFLGNESLKLNVVCDGETTFALELADNRSTSTISPYLYGLGRTSANEKLGGYEILYESAITDAGSKSVIASLDDGKTWRKSDFIPIDPGSLAGVGDYSAGSWYPSRIKTLSMDMFVGAYIAPADSLTLTDEVTIDGSATLQIKYL
ncbi:DUF1120 domain-containing protein [Pseudomonas hormoni]